MKKYKVYGSISVGLCIDVMADDEDDAINKAYEEFGGVNQISDRTICVDRKEEVLVAVDSDTEFTNAEEDE